MRHRAAELVPDAVLTSALVRTPIDLHVIWTGGEIVCQPGSLRSRALACVTEIGRPISLRTVLQRAAQLEDGMGLDPNTVRSSVRLHQTSKPAVVLLVRRLPSGDYVAVTDIPYAGSVDRRLSAGDLVLDRRGQAYWGGVRASPEAAA